MPARLLRSHEAWTPPARPIRTERNRPVHKCPVTMAEMLACLVSSEFVVSLGRHLREGVCARPVGRGTATVNLAMNWMGRALPPRRCLMAGRRAWYVALVDPRRGGVQATTAEQAQRPSADELVDLRSLAPDPRPAMMPFSPSTRSRFIHPNPRIGAAMSAICRVRGSPRCSCGWLPRLCDAPVSKARLKHVPEDDGARR